MSTAMHVRESENGLVRLFALDLPLNDARALAERPDEVAALLDQAQIDAGQFEVFDTADLAGMGLESYLAEGHAIPETDLAPLRWQLDALDGPVLILRSAAIVTRPTDLMPRTPLRWIATFGETEPSTPVTRLQAESALGTGAQPAMPGRRRGSLWSLVLALLLTSAVALAIWLIAAGGP